MLPTLDALPQLARDLGANTAQLMIGAVPASDVSVEREPDHGGELGYRDVAHGADDHDLARLRVVHDLAADHERLGLRYGDAAGCHRGGVAFRLRSLARRFQGDSGDHSAFALASRNALRYLRVASVFGWSGPRAFSRIAQAAEDRKRALQDSKADTRAVYRTKYSNPTGTSQPLR